jgi:hypothetical protein
VVRSSNDNEQKIAIEYENVMTGCGVMNLTLTRVDDKSLKVTFRDPRWGSLDLNAQKR